MTRVSYLQISPPSRAGIRKFCRPAVLRSFPSAIPPMIPFPPSGPDLVLLDLTGEFTFETLADTHARMPGCNIVIRVGPMSRELIFQALEYGVRGILSVQLPRKCSFSLFNGLPKARWSSK